MYPFRTISRAAALILTLTFTAGCGGDRDDRAATADTPALADTGTPAGTSATIALRDSAGADIGTAELRQEGSGVRLLVSVTGLPPGSHGIHFHENGSCEHSGGEAFGGAGAHFSPEQRQHGLENPQGPHAGDLPNLAVGSDGAGRLEGTTDRVTLASGPNSLIRAGGTSLVIHASPDDQRTDPSGNSGARVACGVIPGA
jgi:superoxide dismutase, Cu-Zn family